MATKPQRKARTDSATAAIEAAKNAALPDLMPPDHVKICEDALPYYRDIVRARARNEWNEFQLTVAAQMAECMAKQVEVEALLMIEGLTLVNARGTVVANPLVGINEALARRQMALSRSLQMIGRVALGDPRDNTKQRQLEAGARQAHKEAAEEEDDLLA